MCCELTLKGKKVKSIKGVYDRSSQVLLPFALVSLVRCLLLLNCNEVLYHRGWCGRVPHRGGTDANSAVVNCRLWGGLSLKSGGGFFVSAGRHFQMLMDGANKVEVRLKMLIAPNSCK